MVSETARRNLLAHIDGERRHDIDAIMAPLSDHPSYVIPDFVLEGREAIRAMYESAMSNLSAENMDEYRRALDDPAVTRWGEDHVVLEYTEAYPLHRNMVVVVHFEPDGRIRSENTYWRGVRPSAPRGDDFLAIPGVVPIV